MFTRSIRPRADYGTGKTVGPAFQEPMMIDEHQCDRTRDELSHGALLDASSVATSRIGRRASVGLDLSVTLALYASMIWLMKPLSFGDTIFYAKDILSSGQQLQLAALRPLLDFGHLLWRPLGWLVLESVRALSLGVLSN